MHGIYSYSAPGSPAAACSHAAARDSSDGQQRAASPSSTFAAAVHTTAWAAGAVGSDALIQRSNSPLMFTTYPEPLRSDSPLSCAGASSRGFQQQQQQAQALVDDAGAFQSGTKCSGWLWKRFGHGHKTKWRRFWFYLEDDRLCYCQADSSSSSSGTRPGSSPAFTSFGMSLCNTTAGGLRNTSGSAAALAAGHVKYIPLDRIPVRPLPHRQHAMDPMHKSHPDVGVAIIDARVLTNQPDNSPKRTVFSLVAGSHTHYLAAETLREAQQWVSAVRECWLHCFSHTARSTAAVGGSSGAVVSQRLLAENVQLRESIQELHQKVAETDSEYWRKWVEEKAKNQVLESKLVNAATYEVLVKTGSIKGAATDARVYIELYGPDFCAAPAGGAAAGLPAGGLTGAATHSSLMRGSSATALYTQQQQRQQEHWASVPAGVSAGLSRALDCGGGGEVRLFDVDSPTKPFQRGAADSFTVLCANVGLPARLKVWHDNTGCHPDWFLAEVKARKKGTKDWVCFPCNRWLSTQLDDGRICRELVAGTSRPLTTYHIVTHTSGVRGAGTDAAVFVQLHGLLGDGLRQQLVGGPDDFARGTINEFEIEDTDLGELTDISIGHDSSGNSSSWHLSHVEVTSLAPTTNSTNTVNPGSTGNFNCTGGNSSSCSSPKSTSSSPVRASKSRSVGLLTSGSMVQRTSVVGSPGGVGGSASAGVTAKAGVTYLFPCDAWLDERLGDGKTERRLQAATSLGSKVWYTLHISTSDVRGAGTDADVHVVLVGCDGSSDRFQLASKPEHFERGSRDTFRLQLPPLGRLEKLLIGHNGLGGSPSWHLSLVEVVEEASSRVTYFAADRWLDAASGDGVSEVTLAASSADPRRALVEYQVCFLTSQLRGSGTDSTVHFELHGERASSGSVKVAAGREAFERGGSDGFGYFWPWLGQLQRLSVWHDNSGMAAGRGPWHLEAVEVSSSRDQQVVTFPCGRWLSAEGQLKVDLQPGHAAGPTRYCFEVVTSNVRGAGTDGALSIELLGSNPTAAGSTAQGTTAAGTAAASAGPWCLDRPGAFARGRTDSFEVQGLELAQPLTLRVDLQGASLNPDWHLSHVVCTVLEGEEGAEGAKWYFNAERWFDTAHGFSASLPCSSRAPGRPDEGQLPYAVKVFTSDAKGAGTDANIAINVMGIKGHSGWRQLPARQESFERGQEDSFTVRLPDLGPLTHLAIKSDGAGEGPAWHLDKVCIIPPAAASSSSSHAMRLGAGAVTAAASRQVSRTASFSADRTSRTSCSTPRGSTTSSQPQLLSAGSAALGAAAAAAAAGGAGATGAGFGHNGQPVWFVAWRWLDAGHGLEVLLEAQGSDPAKSLLTYGVEVHTSDLKNAGTDARVMLQLVGDKGSSCRLELQDATAPADCFLRGTGDAFSLQLPRLGQLSKARLWLEGPGSPWHLNLLVVAGPDGDVTYFPCGAWLRMAPAGSAEGPVLGSAAQPLELLGSSQDPRQQLREYKVVTRTSDLRGAATDAAVYVELVGEHNTSSGTQLLTPAGPQAFERGSADEFRLLLRQGLGELQQLRVVLDGSGARHPTWHLLQVEVTDVADGSTWYFDADCWLDAAATAAQGTSRCAERLLTASRSNPLADRKTYQVAVYTSKRQGASTHGAVFVTLQGSPGLPITSASDSSIASPSRPQLQQQQQQQQVAQAICPRASAGAAAAAAAATGWRSSGRHELLGDRSGGFEEGSAASRTLPSVRSLGQLRQLTLELQSATASQQTTVTQGEPCSWHCQHVEVLCTSTGECWLFPCNAWLSSSSSSSSSRTAAAAGAISAAAAAAGSSSLLLYPAPSLSGMWRQLQLEQEQEQQEELTVAVYTADVAGAGTELAVSVTLYGAAGDAGPFKLAAPGRSCFQQGSCDVFSFKAASKLGQLLRLEVECDGPGHKSAWLLDTVSVTAKSSGVTTWFYAGRWLGRAAGLKAELDGSSTDARGQLVAYKVTMHTSDVRDAGTNACVHVDICGSTCCSGPQILSKSASSSSSSSSSDYFQRGQAGRFEVVCRELGELSELRVWHDGSGVGSRWHLAYAEVQHVQSGQVWYFPCNQWLDSSQGDNATRATLKATRSFDPASLQCRYRVAVTTANVRGAGTDANVYVVIHGSQGDTAQKALAKRGVNCFERGRRDEFSVAGADVGVMSHVVLGHDGSGLGPAWHVAELEVQHMGTGQLLKFTVNRWLDAKRSGGTLQCELWPGKEGAQRAAAQQATGSSQAAVEWELVIITGKVLGAGTDADVFITLKGSSSTFGPYTLPAGPEAFENGCRDKFKLSTPELGDLQEVVIGHNNLGLGPAWFLQGLELQNLSCGTKYVFKVSAWLDVQSGCSRTLKAVQQQQGQGLLGKSAAVAAGGGPSSCSYQLEIQTSDVQGAGTDAAVFVQLGGSQGQTDAMQLQAAGSSSSGISGRALFQRGCLDVFILRGLPDVGALTQLLIGHDGSGTHPAWHLDWVRVVNLATGDRALFSASTWLDVSLPGSSTWVQLPATPDNPAAGVPKQQQRQQPGQLGGHGRVFGSDAGAREDAAGAAAALKLTKAWLHSSRLGQPGYTVTFTTSNILGAGTAARVFFELVGEHGSSGVVYATSQAKQFSRGHATSFLYPRLPYLGQLHQLRVGCDGSGMFAPWHLRLVEVVHVHSSQRWLFDCHEWIDKKCMWQRVLPAVAATVV